MAIGAHLGLPRRWNLSSSCCGFSAGYWGRLYGHGLMPLRRLQQDVQVQVHLPCPLPPAPCPCRASAGYFSSVCRSILQGFRACQGQHLETSSEIWREKDVVMSFLSGACALGRGSVGSPRFPRLTRSTRFKAARNAH